jgi:hypothetical protein
MCSIFFRFFFPMLGPPKQPQGEEVEQPSVTNFVPTANHAQPCIASPNRRMVIYLLIAFVLGVLVGFTPTFVILHDTTLDLQSQRRYRVCHIHGTEITEIIRQENHVLKLIWDTETNSWLELDTYDFVQGQHAFLQGTTWIQGPLSASAPVQRRAFPTDVFQSFPVHDGDFTPRCPGMPANVSVPYLDEKFKTQGLLSSACSCFCNSFCMGFLCWPLCFVLC